MPFHFGGGVRRGSKAVDVALPGLAINRVMKPIAGAQS